MKTIVSGIQPSGVITLGNYIGALKNFVALQTEMSDYEFFIFIADLHAITTPQEKLILKKNIRSLAALYVACGLDPNRVNLFVQSEVLEHSALGYIMETTAYMGELERMTQYKDKMQKQVAGVTAALFTYPALMASDIMLYDATYVPVGDDQKQHLELTRDLATRFNNRFGKTFIVPEPLTVKQGAKIMSLVEPTKKMSKSDELDKSYISLLDEPSIIRKKIMSSVTDSEGIIRFDVENKPGISNLLTIYSAITKKSIESIQDEYINKGYGEFKSDLAEIVVAELAPIQDKYKSLITSEELDIYLNRGAERARQIAGLKLQAVYKKIGLGRK
ncbi:MAG TPA: tryptophan--tRNA ligase [Bacilli bacterium]|nr:tryptophan--tRNA ligase [Bacilli bacterium]